MLLKILGWVWVISGILFCWKPEWLLNKIQKKGLKKMKRFFFGIALVLGVLLIKAGWGIPGILAKIVIILGVLAVFKGVFFLKSKAADRVLEWYVKQPIYFFRIWAGGMIALGMFFLFVK